MSAMHDDFRAMVAELPRRVLPAPVFKPAAQIERPEGYARWVSTCSLCGSESAKQVCGGCSAYLQRTGGKL